MKKYFFLIGFVLILFIIGFVKSSQITNDKKIDKYVHEFLKNNTEVKVIIELKEPTKTTGGIININKTSYEIEKEKNIIRERVKNNLNQKKVRHTFDNSIAVNVSKNDLQKLVNSPDVIGIRIDRPLTTVLQDSVPLINATKVWQIKFSGVNITGVGETICEIDTGVNFNHPDLIGKNKTCVIDCLAKPCVENCSMEDDNGHGTHVAGIIAASGGIYGVAPGANLIAVKMMDASGSGNSADLMAAMDWCIANSVKYNISVMTMSIGTNCNKYPQWCYTEYCDYDETDLSKRVDNATLNNISVIIASGNDGSSTKISDPACLRNATAVARTNKDDTINTGCNRNKLVDLVAPGTSINSTSNSGDYIVMSGTSMSTPHVAGAFALVRQYFKLEYGRTPTPFEIQDILNRSAKKIYDSSSGLNYSRIDVYSAINLIPNLIVYLLNPQNNSYTNKNISFSCSFQTVNSKVLTNVTFMLWNSSSNLIYNLSLNVSGNTNSSYFNYNFSSEGWYFWNCLVFNNESENSFADNNYSILYDITSPQINLLNPLDSSSYNSTSQEINFIYNVSDNFEIANCSLIINNIINLTNSSIDKNLIQIFNQTFSSGGYNWKINCTDFSGNLNSSPSRNFSITSDTIIINSQSEIQNSGKSSSSGGTSGSLSSIYIPSYNEIINGYNKELKKKDKIKFFLKTKYEEHVLTVEDIKENFVNLTLESNLINFLMFPEQSLKFNISSSNYYEVYIKLNSINNDKANITLQAIDEFIPKENLNKTKNNSETEKKFTILEKNNSEENPLKDVLKEKIVIYILISSVIGIITMLIGIFLGKKITKNEIAKKKPSRK